MVDEAWINAKLGVWEQTGVPALRQEENASGKEEKATEPVQEKGETQETSKRKRVDEATDGGTEEPQSKKQKTSGNFTKELIGEMKRKDLQALAKKFSIPANISNDEMKKRLIVALGL